MGILHSTTRFLTSKQKDEEEEEDETPIHPHLQNHYISSVDSSENSPKLLIFTVSIYKALKFLLKKVSSIFYLAKPRKAAGPLLPVQNPASAISTEPLLVQTPPISSPTTTFSDEESECDGDEDDDGYRVIWCEKENYSGDRNNQTDHRVVVSVPELTRSLACASASEEMMCAAVFVEENAGMNSAEEEREEVEIKSVIVVGEERWIKYYSNRHRILLVGEGDFSFSACLALAFRCAPNIIATSLNSQAFLKENYGNALTNIEELRSRGSKVMHGINATTMSNHELLGHLRFDRIVFNFPYAGLGGYKNLPPKLVSGFLENAREMISEKGEIHITHKTNGFHGEWEVVAVACGRGLRLIEAVKFNHRDYRGYKTKCGFGGNRYFNCNPCKTYKFGL